MCVFGNLFFTLPTSKMSNNYLLYFPCFGKKKSKLKRNALNLPNLPSSIEDLIGR